MKCKNCGWGNDVNLSRCMKCDELLYSDTTSILNKTEIKTVKASFHSKGTSTKKSLIWRLKSSLYIFAIISTISVVFATLILYSFYGPLTPNGNRYFHSFNMMTVPFYLVLLAIGAMATLYYPIYKLHCSKYHNNFSVGIFPASKSIISKVISVLLSILNVGSGLIYTVSFILITLVYVSNSNRIMVEDLETVLLIVGYIGCMLFWGIVDLVYTLIFKRNW